MIPRGSSVVPWVAFVAVWAALAALLAAAGAAPGVPYNVRELLSGPRGFLAAMALPLVGFLWAGAPAAAAHWVGAGAVRRAALLPLLAAASGVAAFALLRNTVSVESLWDIVGWPVLGWPGDWEIAARFVMLFAVIWMLIAGGAALAVVLDSSDRRGSFRVWIAAAAPVLLLGYVVIVPWAATDNLTELIRGGGSVVGAAVLAAWFLAVGGVASLASRAMAGSRGGESSRARRWSIAATAVALSYPVGYLFVMLGTAARIEKYGATFSAMQFLLSPDREHYASGPALIALYAIAHTLAWVGIALAQFPAWLAARAR